MLTYAADLRAKHKQAVERQQPITGADCDEEKQTSSFALPRVALLLAVALLLLCDHLASLALPPLLPETHLLFCHDDAAAAAAGYLSSCPCRRCYCRRLTHVSIQTVLTRAVN